ncbi:Sec-independent protein translocase protein TatB [Aliikangiella coralliicola]|uniref:Sec-independent protein translocase protein TatB n=1 Tax=Aliikangiella coralliicola TaxID=2592383 RepID=A0A545UHT4_9GAMM|nr:Sec-independent protein translocase protein TatB [Aliikangiella coralliicola]TQV88973.1 twin-arginine translocase subunit TatB [Aliikangiella coralliicola]
MFDIGFLELFIIGVIALIVLGPERLPKAARTVGLWVGKAKQSFNSIKQEIDRELKVQELQQQLEEQKAKLEEQVELKSLKEELSETQNTINNISDNFSSSLDDKTAEAEKEKKLPSND